MRDTDKDWALIGLAEPYFGVLTEDRFKRSNLTDDTLEEFYRSGRNDTDHYLREMRSLGNFRPTSALDFGCGVGRLTIPLAEITGSATGVDVSPGMLAQARKCSRDGLSFVDTIPARKFDWVVSNMVLQHIPPKRGYAILKQLLDCVSPTGGAMVQVMFARTTDHRHSIGAKTIIADGMPEHVERERNPSEDPHGTMQVYDYDMSAIIAMFYASGIKRLVVEHCDHGGMIGGFIYGLKPVFKAHV